MLNGQQQMKLPFEQTEGLWLALCPCVAAFRQDVGTIASIEIIQKSILRNHIRLILKQKVRSRRLKIKDRQSKHAILTYMYLCPGENDNIW